MQELQAACMGLHHLRPLRSVKAGSSTELAGRKAWLILLMARKWRCCRD